MISNDTISHKYLSKSLAWSKSNPKAVRPRDCQMQSKKVNRILVNTNRREKITPKMKQLPRPLFDFYETLVWGVTLAPDHFLESTYNLQSCRADKKN